MRRIAIIGASGSGKTTLARALSSRLEIPHVELDALHFGPGWREANAEDFRRTIARSVEGDAWVIDSFYHGKLGELVPMAADTIVWLDLPLHTTMLRLLRRTALRLVRGTELWHGNRESLRGAFWGRNSLFGYAIQRHAEYRRTLPALFADARYREKTIVRLRTQAEIDRFVGDCGT